MFSSMDTLFSDKYLLIFNFSKPSQAALLSTLIYLLINNRCQRYSADLDPYKSLASALLQRFIPLTLNIYLVEQVLLNKND